MDSRSEDNRCNLAKRESVMQQNLMERKLEREACSHFASAGGADKLQEKAELEFRRTAEHLIAGKDCARRISFLPAQHWQGFAVSSAFIFAVQ